MDHVYEKYFGLSEPPFNITPDPLFLYRSASHQEALAQLSYGIKARKGFVVLTGEVGTGKTTLIRSLLQDLGDNSQTALIFSVVSNPTDLLRYICEEFHLIEPRQRCDGMHDYLALLNEFLLQKYREDANCALIIDEAQNLSSEVLESIRLLSNFETAKDKLLQIVLVGQPELAMRLNSQELRQLKQRITLRHELRALNLSECREYVSNRLRIAGGDPATFTQAALESVYRYSGGIPRLVNVLGDNALLTSYAMDKKQVDEFVIREVAQDLNLSVNGLPKAEISRNLGSVNLNGATSRSPAPGTVKSISSIPSRLKQNLVGASNLPGVALTESHVPVRLFDALRSELTEAMGPMAHIVIEDRIRKLGYTARTFPEKDWGTLIDSVSEEILEPSMRRKFQQSLAHRIPALQSSGRI